MTNQRLVLLETSYGTGILFDQKDTVQAYQILSRATMVSTGAGDSAIFPKSEDIDIKLIAPSRLMSEKEFIASVKAPETAPSPSELPCPF